MAKREESLSVRDLTRKIKETLEGSPDLVGFWVRGEISNYKRHSSGHLYFTLKDDQASIRCIMFKSRALRLRFEPEEGMAVLLYGSIGVYERDGQYQVYVDDIQAGGIGSLYKAFVQLKSRLEAEGLFDKALKRRLPQFPRRIGIVTSLKGAAVRDIINIAKRRWPGVSLVLSDVLVQGEGAPQDIIRGLTLISRVPDIDVIIVGRGGGSIEELWAFNSEALARAIRACPVPVVSAVGHETDFTIADFVSDLRAPTPSAAAELVVPDMQQICSRVSQSKARMAQSIRRMLSERRYAVSALMQRPVLRRSMDMVNQRRQSLDEAYRSMSESLVLLRKWKVHRLGMAAQKLDALSPLRILGSGYSICTLPDGTVVKSKSQVNTGDNIGVRLLDGQLACKVLDASNID